MKQKILSVALGGGAKRTYCDLALQKTFLNLTILHAICIFTFCYVSQKQSWNWDFCPYEVIALKLYSQRIITNIWPKQTHIETDKHDAGQFEDNLITLDTNP